ncbi:hypothetical protein OROMI_020444 [Orobanche minor]
MTDEVSIKLKIPKFSISKSKKLIIVLQELQKRSQKSAEWNARTKANKEKMRLASLMGDKEELEQDEEMMEEAEPSPERDEEGGWQLTRQEWINMKEDVTNMKKMIENFMQLDLGHLRINNAFSWHGCREEDFSVVHLDVLHAEILGINLAVGINGSVGNPVIREGREVHVYVRRSLRDVFRKIPTFSLEVKGRAYAEQSPGDKTAHQRRRDTKHPPVHSGSRDGPSHVRRRPRSRPPNIFLQLYLPEAKVAYTGVLTTFVMASFLTLFLHIPKGVDVPFNLCLSVVVSGTAIPLLTRLITDLKIGKSDIGRFVVSAGIHTDLVSTILICVGFVIFDPLDAFKYRALKTVLTMVSLLVIETVLAVKVTP